MKPENYRDLKKYMLPGIVVGAAMLFGSDEAQANNSPVLSSTHIQELSIANLQTPKVTFLDYDNIKPETMPVIEDQSRVLEENIPVRIESRVQTLTPGKAFITGYYCEFDSGPDWLDDGGYCEYMRNGEIVYEGAAACGENWVLGTELYIENLDRTVICKDTGYLKPNQIDVFSYYSSGLVTTQESQVEVVR